MTNHSLLPLRVRKAAMFVAWPFLWFGYSLLLVGQAAKLGWHVFRDHASGSFGAFGSGFRYIRDYTEAE